MLQRRGHQIVAVVAGTNQTRILPTFFEQAFAVPVRPILSPGFSLKQHRSISMPATSVHPSCAVVIPRRA